MTDHLTPEALRQTLTHDELRAIVISLAERGDSDMWHGYAHDEHSDVEAIHAWAALVDAVRRRHPSDIDAFAFWLLFRCTEADACSECVARPVGNIWPRLWSTFRCLHHAIQHAVDVPVQTVRVSA